MIVNTKTGLLITGTLVRDAEYRTVGAKETPCLRFGVRYGQDEVEGPDGRRQGKILDVTVWGDAAVSLQNCLHKGDAVMAAGELSERVDNQGRTWRSLNNRGEVWPGMAWLVEKMATADIAAAAAPPPPDPSLAGDFEPVIGDDEDLPF